MGPQRSSVLTSFYRKLYPKDPDSSDRGHVNLGKAAEECDLLIWTLALLTGLPIPDRWGSCPKYSLPFSSPQVSQSL